MSRTFAAAATGLPVLHFTGLPELEGTALRLHVSPVVTARWPTGDRGYALLSLCPGDDPDEPAALVRLPLVQAEALARACAAFNTIMDAAGRDAGAERNSASRNAGASAQGHFNWKPPAEPRVKDTPPMGASAGPAINRTQPVESLSKALSEHGLAAANEPISAVPNRTPSLLAQPATEPRAQALVTAAAQLAILAGVLPAVAARCFGLI